MRELELTRGSSREPGAGRKQEQGGAADSHGEADDAQ